MKYLKSTFILLLLFFALPSFADGGGDIKISCLNCEEVNVRDCDICKSGEYTLFSGLMIEYPKSSRRKPDLIPSGFIPIIDKRTKSVKILDWYNMMNGRSSKQIVIRLEDTKYKTLTELVAAIKECQSPEGAPSADNQQISSTVIGGDVTISITGDDPSETVINPCDIIADNCDVDIDYDPATNTITHTNIAGDEKEIVLVSPHNTISAIDSDCINTTVIETANPDGSSNYQISAVPEISAQTGNLAECTAGGLYSAQQTHNTTEVDAANIPAPPKETIPNTSCNLETGQTFQWDVDNQEWIEKGQQCCPRISRPAIPVDPENPSLDLDCTKHNIGDYFHYNISDPGNINPNIYDYLYQVVSDGAGGCAIQIVDKPNNASSQVSELVQNTDSTAIYYVDGEPTDTICFAPKPVMGNALANDDYFRTSPGVPVYGDLKSINNYLGSPVGSLDIACDIGHTTYSLVGNSNNGFVLLNSDGSFCWTPYQADYLTGSAVQFTYEILCNGIPIDAADAYIEIVATESKITSTNPDHITGISIITSTSQKNDGTTLTDVPDGACKRIEIWLQQLETGTLYLHETILGLTGNAASSYSSSIGAGTGLSYLDHVPPTTVLCNSTYDYNKRDHMRAIGYYINPPMGHVNISKDVIIKTFTGGDCNGLVADENLCPVQSVNTGNEATVCRRLFYGFDNNAPVSNELSNDGTVTNWENTWALNTNLGAPMGSIYEATNSTMLYPQGAICGNGAIAVPAANQIGTSADWSIQSVTTSAGIVGVGQPYIDVGGQNSSLSAQDIFATLLAIPELSNYQLLPGTSTNAGTFSFLEACTEAYLGFLVLSACSTEPQIYDVRFQSLATSQHVYMNVTRLPSLDW